MLRKAGWKRRNHRPGKRAKQTHRPGQKEGRRKIVREGAAEEGETETKREREEEEEEEGEKTNMPHRPGKNN